jgi:hypothetical protein
MSLTRKQINLLKETIRSTVQSVLKENNGLTSALAQAFAQKDKKSIQQAAQACMQSGLPRSHCDDAIRDFVEKSNDQESAQFIAQNIDALLEDPENWSSFGKQTDREKEIGRLNIN